MAWVQGPTFGTASAASVSKTFTSSTPAGNLVVVVVTQNNGANPVRAITNVRDNVDTGVDYTFLVGKQDATPNSRVDIYYKVASSAGTRTVTCTFTGGSADADIAINEYDSTHTTASVTNSNGGTTSPATPGSVTPAGTALYIVGLCHDNNGAMTPDAAWNERQEDESLSNATINVHDKITSGAQNPSTTMGATIGTWNAVIGTFEAAAPTINTQPTPQTCYEGQTSTFTISATASAGSLSYQWKDDGSNVGTDSNSYTTATGVAATDNGAQITCVVTDSNGSKTSDAATWTVLHASKPFYIKA